VKYIIPEGALKELNDFRSHLLSCVGRHLITRDQARKMHTERVRQICSQARAIDDNDSRAVPIQCVGCSRIIIIRPATLRYHCQCSPSVERFTHQSREIDLPIGTALIDRFNSANTGREVL
jgi:hypothetical protein